MSISHEPEQVNGPGRPHTSAGTPPLYGEEERMATSRYVGMDVSKDRLDVAVLGETQTWQVDNIQKGINELVSWMQQYLKIRNPSLMKVRLHPVEQLWGWILN